MQKRLIVKILLVIPMLMSILFFSKMATGQDYIQSEPRQWPMPGAKWSYCASAVPGQGSIMILAYTRDTIINNMNWQVIERLDYSNETIPVLITRFSNDSVYSLVNGDEHLLFSYTTNLNDEYDIIRMGGNGFAHRPDTSACTSEMHLKVVAKGELVFNTISLTTWDIQDVDFNDVYNYSEALIYKLVERIGVVNNFHFINPNEFSEFCGLISEWLDLRLIEYSDSTFSYQSPEECLGVGVLENTNQIDVAIYPNPTHGRFQIDCPSCSAETTVTIYSQLGQLIMQRTIGKGSVDIDLTGFHKGLYFIVVQDEIKKYYCFKVLKDE